MPELIYLVIPGQEDIIAFSLFAKSFARLELMHIYLFVHLSMNLSICESICLYSYLSQSMEKHHRHNNEEKNKTILHISKAKQEIQ